MWSGLISDPLEQNVLKLNQTTLVEAGEERSEKWMESVMLTPELQAGHHPDEVQRNQKDQYSSVYNIQI